MYPLPIIPWHVLADRAAGFPSCAVVRSVSGGRYDLVGRQYAKVWQDQKKHRQDWQWLSLCDILLHGDIWVAFFNCHFFKASQPTSNRIALKLLKAVGVKIVMLPHGCDVFYDDDRPQRFAWIRRLQEDYPDWDLRAEADAARWRVSLFCELADFVIGADSATWQFLPRDDARFRGFPVDCGELRPAVSTRNEIPVIVHAPNHRNVKGTDILVDAVRCLQKMGIQCELRLVENVARESALHMYAEADVVADQFCIGSYGLFALEAMALGKPVLTYLDREMLANPVYCHPLVNTQKENIVGVLAALLLLPELRHRLGAAGRSSVERFDAVAPMAEVYRRIYEHVWWGKPLDLETTQHFSPERRSRSFSEDPADPEFWPVPVGDLIERIREALARVDGSIPLTKRSDGIEQAR